jgi:hypothetical protein
MRRRVQGGREGSRLRCAGDGGGGQALARGDCRVAAGFPGAGQQRVELIQAGPAFREYRHGLPGTVVIHCGQLAPQPVTRVLELLQPVVDELPGVHEPPVGGCDGLNAQDRRERVEELTRGSGRQPSEVVGAQERPVRL